MERTERAVVRLTEPHTEMTEAGAVDWPPLLAWLEQSVTEIVGRAGGGSGGGGLPLNTDAMALLNHVDARLRMMQDALGWAGPGDRVVQVAGAWKLAKTQRAAGYVDDVQWEAICDEFPEWVARIEAEDDRPRKIELTVPCPACGQRWVLADRERVSAVRIEFKSGGAPVAECRNPECATIWAGWNQIRALGVSVGANQDLAILKACGIDTTHLLEATT